jgi:beta-mannosidase
MMRRTSILVAGCLIFGNLMATERINLSWELGYPDPAAPGSVKWTPAEVPGAVQLDIARAEGYGTWYYAENWRDYLWMEDQEFVYRSRFPKPSYGEGEKVWFTSLGIDYSFTVSLNGLLLHRQEGMFTPVRLDVTELLGDQNELLVTIAPIPKKHPMPADRSQAAASVKPAVSYGWDWHPRLVPSGIWDETFMEVVPPSHVSGVEVSYQLDEELSRAEVGVEVSGNGLEGCTLQWRLSDAENGIVYETNVKAGDTGDRFRFTLEHPRLWWPHDHGTPYLYHYSLEVTGRYGDSLQAITGTTGFRRVRLVMNEGGWNGPEGFPKSRSVFPIQLEINGRNIFCKGTNWVNPEVFPGRITGERYGELLDRALEANFNMLRVWGGGIINKTSFHDLCDEKGILVWQEFPLACNNYEGTPEYLRVLEQESASIIRRIRSHPSLALWSGGNELFNSWSRMTDQSLAIRLLNSQCLELDPNTPFISTSPMYGMGHGHYVFRDQETGVEVYATMNGAGNTAYTEFGVPSPSPVEILQSIIPPDELWPPKHGASWESHHAYNSWGESTWLMQEMIEDYFGVSGNLEDLVANGQLIQCEGYKAIFEEARRQKPYCSMALNWCFNEPWPTAANNSIVNWPDKPKPAFYAVRDACRPVMASARNVQLKWKEGELFRAQLWMLNDRYQEVAGGTVNARLVAGKKAGSGDTPGGEVFTLGSWQFPGCGPNMNLEGPELSLVLPRMEGDRFTLELEVEGHPEYSSFYTFLFDQ